MRTKKVHYIDGLIAKICSGDFDCCVIESLFSCLRYTFSGDPIMLDLANFVAHNENRDKGLSFDYVQKVLNDLYQASQNGGQLVFKKIFIREDIIEKTIKKLVYLKFNFDLKKFRNQKGKIIDCIKTIMEDTEFEIEIDCDGVKEKKECFLYKDANGSIMISTKMNLRGPCASCRNFNFLLLE